VSASETARAAQRAARLYARSQGLQTAYMAGVRTKLAGNSGDLNPYRNRAGYGSAYRAAWNAGFVSVSPDDE
jgi:hypothetical protein